MVGGLGGGGDLGEITATGEDYDLVVIGAGIGGLTAALYYREQIKRTARILILDNHDDFGGHARRCEFTVDGQWRIAYGGAQNIESPVEYSARARRLLARLGVDLERVKAGYDQGFFKRHRLSLGIFYDKASYGRSEMLASGLPGTKDPSAYAEDYTPGQTPAPPAFAATLKRAPLSIEQRKKLRELIAVSPQAKLWFKGEQGKARFFEKNYVQFLREVYTLHDPVLIALVSMPLAEDSAIGGVGVSLPAAVDGGLLGLPPADFFSQWNDERDGDEDEDDSDDEADEADQADDGVYYFPDGNATLARLLVRQLIPDVAKFDSVEQCLTARFDYGKLDRPDAATSIRLRSLAVLADTTPTGCVVRYVKDGKQFEVRARHTVMAGWHTMAAHIIPSLPSEQKAAMRANIKLPLVYAQVALRQWAPIERNGIGAAYCPSSYFQFVQMEHPIGLGRYRPKRAPNSPSILLMVRMPSPLLSDGSVIDSIKQGRMDLLATDFAMFETQIRNQLDEMYGRHGFNAERDIAAITINRWPHGYVFEEARYQGAPAHLKARKRHGNIVMAGADSAGRAYTDAAIDMAWRAVQELNSS